MTTQEWTDDEPHTFLVALTTPDDHLVAAIDLHYELAIERPAPEFPGFYVAATVDGARVVVDDGTISAADYLDADGCIRAAHYLLACAKAAVDRQAADS